MNGDRVHRVLGWLLPVIMVGLLAVVARLSWRMGRSSDGLIDSTAERYVWWAVGLLVAAGLLFVLWLTAVRVRGGMPTVAVLAAGLAMRLVMFDSQPLLEDDHWRYLWDGAVVAAGENPYSYSPLQVLEGGEGVPQELRELSAPSASPQGRLDGAEVLDRVNHPEIRTIYPPVTQAVFATAHEVHPWRLWPLRLILLAASIATFVIVLRLLAALGLPRWWVSVYWCNPLVAMLTIGACHVDVIAAGLAAAAVWLTVLRRPVLAMAVLGVGVGAKIWPIVLLPLLLRPWLGRGAVRAAADSEGEASIVSWRRGLVALAVGVGVSAAMLWPLVASGVQGQDAAVQNLATRWSNNEAIFAGQVWLWGNLLPVFDVPEWHRYVAARIATLALLAVVGLILIWRRVGPRAMVGRCVILLAAGLFLGPTVFPWYWLWLVPLLAVTPWWSLAAGAAVLPLYYLWVLDNAWAVWSPWIQSGLLLTCWAVEVWARRGPWRPKLASLANTKGWGK